MKKIIHVEIQTPFKKVLKREQAVALVGSEFSVLVKRGLQLPVFTFKL